MQLPWMRIAPTAKLDEPTLARMFAIYQTSYATDEASFRARAKDNLEHTMLYYAGRELVGFCGLRERPYVLSHGEIVHTVYIGQVVVHPRWRGMSYMQLSLALLAIRKRLRHPTRRIFGIMNALSIRSYLVAARNLAEYYPSPFWEWPPDLLELRDRVGESLYGEHFERATGVIRKPRRTVLDVDIDPTSLEDPRAALYARLCGPDSTDSESAKGLLTIMPATLDNSLFGIRRQLRRRLGR